MLTKKFTAMKAIVHATMKLLREANLSRLIDHSSEYPPDIMTLTHVKQFDELHTTNPQMSKRVILNSHVIFSPYVTKGE